MSREIQDNFRRVRADFVQRYLALGVSLDRKSHFTLSSDEIEEFAQIDNSHQEIWDSLIDFYKADTHAFSGSFDGATQYQQIIEQLKFLENDESVAPESLKKPLDKLIYVQSHSAKEAKKLAEESATKNAIRIDKVHIPDYSGLQLISDEIDDNDKTTLNTDQLTVISEYISVLDALGLTSAYQYFSNFFGEQATTNTEGQYLALIQLIDFLNALQKEIVVDNALPFEEFYPQIYIQIANQELLDLLVNTKMVCDQNPKALARKTIQRRLNAILKVLSSQATLTLDATLISHIAMLKMDDPQEVSKLADLLINALKATLTVHVEPKTGPTTSVAEPRNKKPEVTSVDEPSSQHVTETTESLPHPYYIDQKIDVTLREAPSYDPELAAELKQSYLDEVKDEITPLIDTSLETLAKPPYQQEALLDLRRGFHTLKGSGYMSGFMYEAEIAWKVEEVLNGCRDKVYPFSEAIWYHVQDGYAAIKSRLNPELTPVDTLERIAYQADYLIKNKGVVKPEDVKPKVHVTPEISVPEKAELPTPVLEDHLQLPPDSDFIDGSLSNADNPLHEVITELTRELESYKHGNFGALKKLTRILNFDHQVTQISDQDPKTNKLIRALFENILLFRAYGLSPQEDSIQLWEKVLIEVNNALHSVPNYEQYDQYIKILKQPIINYQHTDNGSEHSAQSHIDNEIFKLFAEEAQEILETADELITDWKLNGYDPNSKLVDELRRQMHTLKGSARMVSKNDIGQLSHALESLLDPKYINQFSSDPRRFEILQRSLDHIPFMLEYKEQKMDQEGYNLLSALHLLLGNETPPELDITGNVEGEDIVTKVTEKTSSAAQAELGAIRIAPYQITDIYENLAENIILNNQQKRNVNIMNNALDELERTIARVNSQARRIEIETEAQMLSRHARVTHDSKDFDPLELDRFSELQQLSRFVMESVEDLYSLHKNFLDQIDKLTANIEKQSDIQQATDQSINNIRTVNFLSIIPRLRRLVRQVSKVHNKKVELITIGTDIQVERLLLEQMIAPFEHMIRNSIIHGIETPDVREKKDKDPTGKITIQVIKKGSDLEIQFSDDGQGIDMAAIRKKALEMDVIQQDQIIDDQKIVEMLMLPGISTASVISQDAGRGVGLDVLAKAMVLLNATFGIKNIPNKGLVFTIHIPFTLTTMKALIVSAGSSKYAIPLDNIVAVDEKPSIIAEPNSLPVIKYQNDKYEVHELNRLYGGISISSNRNKRGLYLLFTYNTHKLAIKVNQVLSQQEVIMKPLNPQISSVPGIAGSSILPNGDIVYIIDIPSVISSGLLHQEETITLEHTSDAHSLSQEIEKQATPMVLVVDDSITMRKVSTRMLERHGLLYTTAKDGLDAIEKFERETPDLIMLDIEMPNMDGFEVLSYLQSHQHLKDIPVIMITSRTGDKHMERALSLGASRYCGKPYQEKEMMEYIQELLGNKWEIED